MGEENYTSITYYLAESPLRFITCFFVSPVRESQVRSAPTLQSPLISVSILEDLLGSPRSQQPLVVLDCRFTLKEPDRGREEYRQGHIPHAHYIDLERELCDPPGPRLGRHPLPSTSLIIALLSRLGLEPSSHVVVYDDGPGLMAARMWWTLRWLGHHLVSLLDGGWSEWVRQNGEISLLEERPTGRSVGYPCHFNPALWVDSDTVIEAVGSSKRVIIDARNNQRFKGEIEPIDRVAGRIPGSLNRPCVDNLDQNGCFKSGERLRGEFLDLAGSEEALAEAIHLCGSGVTACHNMIALEEAGLPIGTLYVGSWSEWITDPARAIETG